MFSRETWHVWSLLREFDGNAARNKLLNSSDKMARRGLSGADLRAGHRALVREMCLCEQGGHWGLDPVQALATWIHLGKVGDHAKSLKKHLPTFLSMSIRCVSHGHFILDTLIHI